MDLARYQQQRPAGASRVSPGRFDTGARMSPAAALTPSSASTATAASPSVPRSWRAERDDCSDLDADTPAHGEAPPRKKQRRNKPTLSCHECVERKTKVRGCQTVRCGADNPRISQLRPDPATPALRLAFSERFAMAVREATPVLTLALQCDRGRPHCLACEFTLPRPPRRLVTLSAGIKRQTECRYAHVANLLE